MYGLVRQIVLIVLISRDIVGLVQNDWQLYPQVATGARVLLLLRVGTREWQVDCEKAIKQYRHIQYT